MPTIPVNDDGAVLYYEDSGPPEGVTDYTTVIILHGFVYHGGTLLLVSILPHDTNVPSYQPRSGQYFHSLPHITSASSLLTSENTQARHP